MYASSLTAVANGAQVVSSGRSLLVSGSQPATSAPLSRPSTSVLTRHEESIRRHIARIRTNTIPAKPTKVAKTATSRRSTRVVQTQLSTVPVVVTPPVLPVSPVDVAPTPTQDPPVVTAAPVVPIPSTPVVPVVASTPVVTVAPSPPVAATSGIQFFRLLAPIQPAPPLVPVLATPALLAPVSLVPTSLVSAPMVSALPVRKSCLKGTTLVPTNKSVTFFAKEGVNIHAVWPFVPNSPPVEVLDLEDVTLLHPTSGHKSCHRGFVFPVEEIYSIVDGFEHRVPFPMPTPDVDYDYLPEVPYNCEVCEDRSPRDPIHMCFDWDYRFGGPVQELSEERLQEIRDDELVNED